MVLTPPENMQEGSEYVLTPENVTFFHSKLLLYNSESFTSSKMKDLCQKYKILNFFFKAHTGCQELGLLSVWKSLT